MPHLEITTQIGCKYNCFFCPQDKLLKNYKSDIKRLDFDMFKRFLDKIPNEIDIHFSGMAEPFLNPHALDMVQYSILKGHKVSVFSTLENLSKSEYDELLKYNYDLFCLHIADNIGLCKFKVNDEYVNKIEYILENRPSARKFWVNCHGKVHDKLKYLTTFGIDNFIIDRAGNVEEDCLPHTKVTGKFICDATGYKLNQNVLLPNGDVYLCCMDYELKHKLGNIMIDDYEDLFKSKEAMNIRKAMAGECEVLCNKCNRAKEVK